MKKLLFLAFFCFQSVALSTQHFDAAWLEHKAEVEGYGYKSANLMLLEGLLKNPEGFSVQVPDFTALSSDSVQYLLSLAGLNIQAEWAAIARGQDLESAIERKTFEPGFIDASQALAQRIRAATKQIHHIPHANEDFAKLDAFLKRSQQKNWRLMVRSTGKEDTDKLANAGGNLSVANVSPEEDAVLSAIGDVAASYFEERSLTQRLSAGDPSIFDAPLIPVLIQRMIGEQLNNVGPLVPKDSIPTGCVLYTVESAGRLKDIHTLQCAFGHNEGVVQSLVPLDTFYVPKNGMTQSVIKNKPKRLVPMLEHGLFGLEEVDNPEGIRNIASLPPDAVLAISKVGQQIDDFYDKRMDIELVYEPRGRAIFIVQARPLIFPTSNTSPSYIAQLSHFRSSRVTQATSINPGAGAVIRITSREQIIVAGTLEDALQIYTAPKTNRNVVKSIVVATGADPTSHAAATFRGDGKTISQASELGLVRNWIRYSSENDLDLLIDTQRELIVDIGDDEAHHQSLPELFESRFLRSGWINYPLPLRVSVSSYQPQYCLSPQMKVETFFGEMTCLVDRLSRDVQRLEDLTKLARHDAHCELSEPGCLESRVAAQEALPKLENLNTAAQQILSEMQKAPTQNEMTQLMTLFPKRYLEALIYQNPSGSISDSYSLESVANDYTANQAFIKNTLLPMRDSKFIRDELFLDAELFEIAAHSRGFTQKISDRFIRFTSEIGDTHDQKRIAQLKTLVQTLKALDVFPLWVNSLFMREAERVDQALQQEGVIQRPDLGLYLPEDYGFGETSAPRILDALWADFERSKPELEQLSAKASQLRSYDFTPWTQVKSFDKARKAFEQSFAIFWQWPQSNAQHGELAQLAFVHGATIFLDVFDQTVKALKGSKGNYKDPALLVQRFQTRLNDYFSLLDKWSRALAPNALPYHPAWPLDAFLQKLHALLLAFDHSETQLFPSENFSVAAATLGRATAFERHFPETLEDAFTLIHQSLNASLSTRVKQVLLPLLVLPEGFKALHEAIARTGVPVGRNVEAQSTSYPLLTGIGFESGILSFHYSLPLENHSAGFTLQYDAETQKNDLLVAFLGEARTRWEQILAYSYAWAYQHNASLPFYLVGEWDLELALGSLQASHAQALSHYLKDMSDSASSEHLTFDALLRLTPDEATFAQLLDAFDRNELPIGTQMWLMTKLSEKLRFEKAPFTTEAFVNEWILSHLPKAVLATEIIDLSGTLAALTHIPRSELVAGFEKPIFTVVEDPRLRSNEPLLYGVASLLERILGQRIPLDLERLIKALRDAIQNAPNQTVLQAVKNAQRIVFYGSEIKDPEVVKGLWQLALLAFENNRQAPVISVNTIILADALVSHALIDNTAIKTLGEHILKSDEQHAEFFASLVKAGLFSDMTEQAWQKCKAQSPANMKKEGDWLSCPMLASAFLEKGLFAAEISALAKELLHSSDASAHKAALQYYTVLVKAGLEGEAAQEALLKLKPTNNDDYVQENLWNGLSDALKAQD